MRKLDVSLTWNFVSVLGYEVFETTIVFHISRKQDILFLIVPSLSFCLF